MFLQHLDKNNLHHAYLVEGERKEILPEIFEFCKNLGIETVGNPDFCHISMDTFKIEDAFNLRAMSAELGFSSGKKVFLICANSLTLESQNTMLKMFEEPIINTHFFLIIPDANTLLKTLVSRFYFIKAALKSRGVGVPTESVGKKFISLPLQKRIDFIKELLAEKEEEDEEGNKIAALDSTRSKALKFLNTLESALHKQAMSKGMSRGILDIGVFEHIFKVREYLRMPGSSAKSLMESVALVMPERIVKSERDY